MRVAAGVGGVGGSEMRAALRPKRERERERERERKREISERER
jgi:hypothetical protein